MKTAEQVLKEHTGHAHALMGASTITAMKEYARIVAQKALEDAAAKYENVTMKDHFGCVCDVPSAILSTPLIIE